MIWRSILFIPVLQERFLAKAASRGADAIVLDLEASIAADRKQEARDALPAAAERLAEQGQDVLVRVNMLWRPALADLEVAAHPAVTALVLPDCRSVAEIRAVDGVLAELEAERGLEPISLIPLIESAKGVLAAGAIAGAAPRVAGLSFGIEDYLADMEMAPDREVLAHTAQAIAHGARAAGKVPLVIPESLANLTDLEAFERAARRGRAMGSVGGFAVHPDQVAVLNRVFSPADDELRWAERVVALAREAEAKGLGAVTLDGRMVDLPIVLRAQALLERSAKLSG